jgi:hypothetical protein
MIDAFIAGGYAMWIVTALGLACLVVSVRFAIRAEPRRLAVIRALTWAQVFSVLSGLLANFLAVMWHVARDPEMSRDPLPSIMVGLGEAVHPGILGFTLLSICWLLVAVGVRRAPDEP